MPAVRDTFGYLQDNQRVDRIALSHPRSGFSIEVLEYGARLRAVYVPDRRGDFLNTVLTYSTLREYELDSAQLGATIGRCANRTVALDHPQFRLTRNEGANHLHGGNVGFSRSMWRTVACTDGDVPSVRLEHHSPDGDEGYRGNVSVRMEYSIPAPLSFRTVVEATTDQMTPINVTLHPYFNLTGDPHTSIDDHELRLASTTYLPIGLNQVPTGEILRVDGTAFDFRHPTRIGARLWDGDPQLRIAAGYDHYWPTDENSPVAAELFSPQSGIRLHIGTNQKGLQFYAGNSLATATPPRFRARAGLCLEPHGFPNAINEPGFPTIMLHPGETYRHTTTYTFSCADGPQ
jgi:aldose 1-epimerase